MKHITKRIIALVLVLAAVLSCAGCTVSYPESEYRAYMKDPVGYLERELGEDHPLIGILSSQLGQMFFTAMFEKSEADKLRDPEPTPQLPEPEQGPALLSYRTYKMDNLFNDQDWEYISRDQNAFIRITGRISHALAGAKKKYKEAFRSYLREFIVDNKDRYDAQALPFEEQKSLLLTFLTDTKKSLSDEMKRLDLANSFDDLNEYDKLIENLEKATDFTKDFDKDFADLMSKTTDFVKKHDIELEFTYRLPKSIKSLGKVADGVGLVLDVADCISSVNDVVTIREKVHLFFEIDEIFTTIIQNSTDYYMQEAAREVLREIHGGEITDVRELIIEQGVNVLLDINPIVSAVTGLTDFVMTNFTPLKDLDKAYAADAVLHLKMACCDRLQEYTVRTEGDTVYYEAQYQMEVNTYLLHCLQTQLVWTYVINDGKKCSQDVLGYENASGIRLPIAANNYIIGAGKRF